MAFQLAVSSFYRPNSYNHSDGGAIDLVLRPHHKNVKNKDEYLKAYYSVGLALYYGFYNENGSQYDVYLKQVEKSENNAGWTCLHFHLHRRENTMALKKWPKLRLEQGNYTTHCNTKSLKEITGSYLYNKAEQHAGGIKTGKAILSRGVQVPDGMYTDSQVLNLRLNRWRQELLALGKDENNNSATQALIIWGIILYFLSELF